MQENEKTDNQRLLTVVFFISEGEDADDVISAIGDAISEDRIPGIEDWTIEHGDPGSIYQP